jgi:hypothetical protein
MPHILREKSQRGTRGNGHQAKATRKTGTNLRSLITHVYLLGGTIHGDHEGAGSRVMDVDQKTPTTQQLPLRHPLWTRKGVVEVELLKTGRAGCGVKKTGCAGEEASANGEPGSGEDVACEGSVLVGVGEGIGHVKAEGLALPPVLANLVDGEVIPTRPTIKKRLYKGCQTLGGHARTGQVSQTPRLCSLRRKSHRSRSRRG